MKACFCNGIKNKKVTASFFKSHNSDFFVPEFVTIQRKKKNFVAEKLSVYLLKQYALSNSNMQCCRFSSVIFVFLIKMCVKMS